MRISDICYGSGSADPYLCLTVPAPDPSIVSDIQDGNKKLPVLLFAYLLFEATFTSSFNDKRS
jgi:hypothetical protein